MGSSEDPRSEVLRAAQFVDARSGHPRWLRALNAAGRLLPRLATPSADAWWKAAVSQERESEGPSPDARRALEALTASLRGDARLNLLGRISARDDTVRMARTHLRIRKAVRDRPEILATELPAPVFIIGLPRTGTTFLHQLLSQDPRNRTIPYWESFDPVPPDAGPDRRPAKVDAMLKQLARIAPDYHAIHPMRAEMAEECVALFMNELRTLQYDIQYRATSYVEWLIAEDARIAYDAYQRQLRLIQLHRPAGERFVLKDPTHIVHLDTLLETFPNAKLVFTHRDPAKSVSSICSLYAHTRAIFSDEVDAQAIGSEILQGYWPGALEAAQTIRAQLPRERYTDVRTPDLADDPIGSAQKLYDALGFELDETARAAMQRFLDVEASKPKSVHEHSPEGFGLTRAAIRERFREYAEAFDL